MKKRYGLYGACCQFRSFANYLKGYLSTHETLLKHSMKEPAKSSPSVISYSRRKATRSRNAYQTTASRRLTCREMHDLLILVRKGEDTQPTKQAVYQSFSCKWFRKRHMRHVWCGVEVDRDRGIYAICVRARHHILGNVKSWGIATWDVINLLPTSASTKRSRVRRGETSYISWLDAVPE